MSDDDTALPVAVPLPSSEEAKASLSTIVSEKQSVNGDIYTLDGHVTIHYRNYTLAADRVIYNQDTQDATATGHLLLTGGDDDESISASHGTMNLDSQTGTFYDVSGSVGLRNTGERVIYTSSNPFLFGGQTVVKTGPQSYHIYHGWVTTCQLPKPDWQLFSGNITVDDQKSRATNSIFHLMGLPLFYLPYVTHPVDPDARQSGLWTPAIGQSNTKGIVTGDEFYLVLNRSSDLTVGLQYYSLRGWEQSASLRFVGRGNDFARLRYSGLVDRGIVQADGGYTNQGGEDIGFSGRHDINLDPHTRLVADAEYLSSYVYREAFSGSFSQAVSSDLTSIAYAVHQWNGFSADIRADRYQGLKRVPVPATPTTPAITEEEVHILHTPSLDFNAIDHFLGSSHFFWNTDASAAGLKRVQPNFVTGGIVERYDFHPQLGYNYLGAGWSVVPTIALRDTYYSRSRVVPYSVAPNPVQSSSDLNRADVEMQVDFRAPIVERTFQTPWFRRFLGSELRHTIEPEVVYRNTRGVDNFLQVLRFDDTDVVSDTDELQYGVTQHLFARGDTSKACPAADSSATNSSSIPSAVAAAADNSAAPLPDLNADAGFGTDPDSPIRTGRRAGPACIAPQKEWISWRLTQKYFFDQTFGNAIRSGTRNIFTSTLDLSGTAFLTEPRQVSPLVSRLRARTTDNIDLEWDFDLDTGAKKFTANNLFLDAHAGPWRAGASYARLNAPGRAYVLGVASAVSNFSQLRLLASYGDATKRGLSLAANAGYDLNLGGLQYGTLQASYNWDCCGISVEYRKFELGSVRNEGSYRFNFTLANIGAAGNLRKAERLF